MGRAHVRSRADARHESHRGRRADRRRPPVRVRREHEHDRVRPGRARAAHRGSLQPGWAVDGAGRPTLDPAVVVEEGGLTPLGGTPEGSSHKGYSLSASVDVLTGILTGTGWSKLLPVHTTQAAHTFVALRIDAFADPATFHRDLNAMLDALRGSAPMEGADRVLVPGDREAAARRDPRGQRRAGSRRRAGGARRARRSSSASRRFASVRRSRRYRQRVRGREERRHREAGGRGEAGVALRAAHRDRDHLVDDDHDHRSGRDRLDDGDRVGVGLVEHGVAHGGGDRADGDDRARTAAARARAGCARPGAPRPRRSPREGSTGTPRRRGPPTRCRHRGG